MAENTMKEPNPPVTLLPTDVAYIRFLNAVPDSLPVDLYINGRLVARALGYQDFTEYLRAFPGLYELQIFPYGQQDVPLFAGEIDLQPYRIYTASFIGCCGEYEVELVPDVKQAHEPGFTYIRFIDFAQKSPGFDIYMDGKLYISDISYEEISKYFALPAGRHSLDVRVTGTKDTVIRHPGMVLKEGNFYGGYIVGFYEGSPELQILLPLEGSSYVKF